MKNLIKDSPAYKIISADKRAGRLNHAYLVTCQDGDMHEEYLKILAKLMACDSDDFCDRCRVCKLIESNAHSDVTFYPKEGKLKTDSADDLVRQSVIKPFELSKRIFVVKKIEELNQYQNKLLKTIEEPPKNVHLLISTARPVAVLPTIKSRSKIVEIPDFSESALLKTAKDMGYEGDRLALAVKLCSGKMGNLIRYYQNDELLTVKDIATDVILNMTGRTLPEYAGKLKNFSMPDFISVTKLLLSKLMEFLVDKKEDDLYSSIYPASQKWRYGSIIGAIERLNGFEKNLNFNINNSMLVDGVLFAVMEEKTKWQKL